MDFKFGIGDRVIIIDTVPEGRYQDHCHFPDSMDQYCGVETTITSVRAPAGSARHEPRYSVSCDNNEWSWIESWLRPVDYSGVDFDADVTELL